MSMARVKLTDPTTGATVEVDESHPLVGRWPRVEPEQEPAPVKTPAPRRRATKK